MFKGIFDKLGLGDQVPEYPIKSKDTLNKIVTQIQGEFPPPTTVAQAQKDLARAQESADIAYGKGGAVNDTYGMIYDKVVQTLKNYISYGGSIPGQGGGSYLPGKAGQLCPDGKNYTDANGMCPSGPSPAKMNVGLIAGLAVVGILLMGGLKPKRR